MTPEELSKAFAEIQEKIQAAVKAGSISIDDRIELTEQLTQFLDEVNSQYQDISGTIDSLFATLRDIDDQPPQVLSDKHLEAVDILKSQIKDFDMNSDQGLTFWAETQKVDRSLNQKVIAGNGIYNTTGLKDDSTLKAVLNKLNKMGDTWNIVDGNFVEIKKETNAKRKRQ